jgi:ABC-2 type transport system ATP-binding protein
LEEYLIEARGLSKTYGNLKAVDDLTISIRKGEIFGFLGPNGAGKTTTILMFLGLTEPTQGMVRVCGFDPVKNPLNVKRRTGYLPEHLGFYEDMTARQNLLYVARLNGISEEEATSRIERALEEVGLEEVADRRVGTFSKGMRQRLGIAEVLIKEPELVLLDEPTIGLDPESTIHMLEMVRSLSRDRGMTVFLSSHLLDQVQRISDRVGIMIKGRLVAEGPIEELAKRKLGVEREDYTLEEIYLKFFREA